MVNKGVGGFKSEWWATSDRNHGRFHSGTVGGFKSEWWARSPGIRTHRQRPTWEPSPRPKAIQAGGVLVEAGPGGGVGSVGCMGLVTVARSNLLLLPFPFVLRRL
jgi:hypothetical protein